MARDFTADQDRLHPLVTLARGDMLRNDLRRAKDRLRAVLHRSPYFQPALELMGHIYYRHGDYRNAVMYWSRADYWDEPMPEACEHAFRAVGRALVHEKTQVARYYLYAFAGASPPPGLGDRLSALRTAYYRLGAKKSRLAGLACAPISGGCLLALLAIICALLGGGWAWFSSLGSVALATTIIVVGINVWAYAHASKLFREAIAPFSKPLDR